MRWAHDRPELPALLLVILLAVGLLAFAILEVGHQGTIQQLRQQAQANVQAIQRDDALLREIRRDEKRYCAAAKAAGVQPIIKIVCGGAGE